MDLRRRRLGNQNTDVPVQVSTCLEEAATRIVTMPILPPRVGRQRPSSNKTTHITKHLSAGITKARLGLRVSLESVHKHESHVDGSSADTPAHHEDAHGDDMHRAIMCPSPIDIVQNSGLLSGKTAKKDTAQPPQMSVLESDSTGNNEMRNCFTQGEDEDTPEVDILLLPEFVEVRPCRSVPDARKSLQRHSKISVRRNSGRPLRGLPLNTIPSDH